MAKPSNEQRKFLERATLQYHDHLSEAEGYLGGRGIDQEHARSNVLGVVRDPLPGHEHLEGRLAIPYITDSGPVNMNFRCIQDHDCKEVPGHRKYMMQKGLKPNLYGVQSISWATNWIAVTEGEIDRLTLTQIGIPAVGVGGAEKWEAHWTNVFEDFSRVYLFEDGDTAGADLYGSMSHAMSHVIRVKMGDGEDVNSTYLARGADHLLSRIRK